MGFLHEAVGDCGCDSTLAAKLCNPGLRWRSDWISQSYFTSFSLDYFFKLPLLHSYAGVEAKNRKAC